MENPSLQTQSSATSSKLPFVLGMFLAALAAGAGGVYVGKTYFAEKIPVTSVAAPLTTVPIATPTTDSTTEWKTYRRDQGFLVQYPPEWFSPFSNCSIPTSNPRELGHGRTIEKNCVETLVFTEKESLIEEQEPVIAPFLVSETKTQVDGLSTKRKIFAAHKGGSGILYQMLVYKNQKLIFVWTSQIGLETDKTNSGQLIKKLDQILSTFRFTQ